MSAEQESTPEAVPRAKPRWAPERHEIDARDLPRARFENDDFEVAPALLGRACLHQHVVGSMLIGRILRDTLGVTTTVTRDSSGILLLECDIEGRSSRGYVTTAVSSMEPRPIWPMLLPLAVLAHVSLDWIVACSVPKMPAIERLDETPAEAYVLGWLDAARLMDLPIVTLEPHLGHEFEAKYRQAKNHQLRPMSQFLAEMHPSAAASEQ